MCIVIQLIFMDNYKELELALFYLYIILAKPYGQKCADTFAWSPKSPEC